MKPLQRFLDAGEISNRRVNHLLAYLVAIGRCLNREVPLGMKPV
jgi:hypothetical protein